MITPSIPKRLITFVALIAIVSVVLLTNVQYAFQVGEAIPYALGSHVQSVDTTKQRRKSRHRKSSSSQFMIPIEDINSTEYLAFDKACIYPDNGPLSWKLLVKGTRAAITATEGEPPTEERDHDQFFDVPVFSLDYNNHSFRVVRDHNFNMTSFRLHRREGAHLLIGPHTPENNFHLLNDLLYPVYRAFFKTEINGVVFFRGCEICWENRLPAMSLVFNMMNLSVTYPLETVVSVDTPICVDRLIIRDYFEHTFYSREGRFSSYWPQEIFEGYRDSSQEYFQSLLSLRDPMGQTETTTRSPEEEANENSDSEISRNAGKPVLTWVPRSSSTECTYRCITNGHELVEELSKYFRIRLLEFNANFTTAHAVVLMRDTDVLAGLHGAGLGYAAYLPDRAMLIELKSALNSEKKMFINMASAMDIPYYGVNLGCLGEFDHPPNYVYTLSTDLVQSLASEIAAAYHQEKINFAHRLVQSPGQCLFPQHINPCGHLSPTNVSRCYLEQRTPDGPWMQCVHFELCD